MPFFHKKIIVWTLDLELQVMRYPKKLTMVLRKATWVHGKVTMAKKSRKKAKNSKFQSIFLNAYLSSFQVLVNHCCVQKQEKDVSKSLSIAASLLRNEKRGDEDCMYMTYPFGLDVNSFQIMQIDHLKRTGTT
jgi:hypothetical protein